MNTILAILLGIFIANTLTMLVAAITNENDMAVYYVGEGIWTIIFLIIAKIINTVGLWYMHHFTVGFAFVDNGHKSWDTFYINKKHIKKCNLDVNAPKHLEIVIDGKKMNHLPSRWEIYTGINDKLSTGARRRKDLNDYLL